MSRRLILNVALFSAIAALAVGSALILAFNDPTVPSLHTFELFPCEPTPSELSWFWQDGTRIVPRK